MKFFLSFLVLLLIPAAAGSQSPTIRLLPDADVSNTGWLRQPESGGLVTKIDEPPTPDGDADYIYTLQSGTSVASCLLSLADPPSPLVAGDMSILVRARRLSGYNTVTIAVNDGGFLVSSQVLSLGSDWGDYSVDLGFRSREEITRFIVQVSADGCQFLPECSAGVSALVVEIRNARFHSGVL